MQRILQKWGSRNYSIDEPMRYPPISSKLLHPVKNIKSVTGEKNSGRVVLEAYLYCIPTRMLQLQLLSKAVHEHLLLLCTHELGTKSSIADLQAAMSSEDSA